MTKTSNAAKSAIHIECPRFYPDASGAPATVECGGYVFACDWLGGYRATLVRPVSGGSRVQNGIAARRVEQAYSAYVRANSPAGWMVANERLYREE